LNDDPTVVVISVLIVSVCEAEFAAHVIVVE
jgi:hypothetical protein